MKKQKIIGIFIPVLMIAAGIIAFLNFRQSDELDFDELAAQVEKSAEEVLGEDVQQVSKTAVVATITYSHTTDPDNNIYYRMLQTTYYEGGAPDSVTGLNTEALSVLFPPELMDSCENMMIKDWPAALYKKEDTAFLCWTYNPEMTYVLEYTPSKMPDSEIIKMAESAEVNE